MFLQLIILSFAASLSGAPDSTVTLGTQLYATGLTTGDTVRYDYYAGTVLKLTKRSVVTDNKGGILAAPAYGATVLYKGCAQIERGGRASATKVPSSPLCWTWSYTRPLPALTADSVKQIVLRPSVAEVPTLATLQYCAFGIMKSGRRVKLQNSWNRPECEPPYQAWLAERIS